MARVPLWIWVSQQLGRGVRESEKTTENVDKILWQNLELVFCTVFTLENVCIFPKGATVENHSKTFHVEGTVLSLLGCTSVPFCCYVFPALLTWKLPGMSHRKRLCVAKKDSGLNYISLVQG